MPLTAACGETSIEAKPPLRVESQDLAPIDVPTPGQGTAFKGGHRVGGNDEALLGATTQQRRLAATDTDTNMQAPLCAVTFDDGPGRYTERLLDILKEKKVVVTFFVLGEFVVRDPQTIRRIANEGHEIENHSFDHPNFRHLDYRSQKAEIDKTDRALRNLGITPKYFRPPYGSYNPATVRAAAEEGLVLALWSIDAMDWKYHTAHALEARVETQVAKHLGGIYLFHDIHPATVSAMPTILSELAARGCKFVTLADYLASQNRGAPVGGPHPLAAAMRGSSGAFLTEIVFIAGHNAAKLTPHLQ